MAFLSFIFFIFFLLFLFIIFKGTSDFVEDMRTGRQFKDEIIDEIREAIGYEDEDEYYDDSVTMEDLENCVKNLTDKYGDDVEFSEIEKEELTYLIYLASELGLDELIEEILADVEKSKDTQLAFDFDKEVEEQKSFEFMEK